LPKIVIIAVSTESRTRPFDCNYDGVALSGHWKASTPHRRKATECLCWKSAFSVWSWPWLV